MGALIGRHVFRIDKKGRISVPKQFRNFLSDQEFAGIFVYPSFKYPAIEACGEIFVQRIIDSLDDLELFSDQQDDIAATVLENSYQLPYDTEGRVILPDPLLKHAKISTDAVFVGRGNRFQIWEPSAYEIQNTAAFARARSRGVTLSLRDSNDGKNSNGD